MTKGARDASANIAPTDEEASELVRAERYERKAGWEAYRSVRYARKLAIGAGKVETSA